MKKALLIGINYRGTDSELNGCINDVINMKSALIEKGYLDKDIVVLTDDTPRKPTKRNILRQLQKLCLSEATCLFFHYSGHGSYVKDTNGDEEDGRDETLVPLDYERAGMVRDDQIRGLLACLADHQRMFCVLDCCHSGTGADLQYNLYKEFCSRELTMKSSDKTLFTESKIVMISGCQDSQTSMDAYIGGKYQGALTSCFLKALTPGITYREFITNILALLKKGNYKQRSNLASSYKLDLDTKVVF